MASASGDGQSSPRQWVTLVTGVAVVSSALSVVGVLGFQRLSRRRRRHELEDDVWAAARRAQRQQQQQRQGGPTSDSTPEKKDLDPGQGVPTAKRQEGHLGPDGNNREGPTTPRYLAAFNTLQDAAAEGAADSLSNAPSRSGSPRPNSALARGGRQSNLPHASSASFGTRPTFSSSLSRRSGISSGAPADYDESLIREQLSRNYSFLGKEAMQKLRGSFVVIVGAGGVGSWCAIMLLRSGVGRLRLIDFDQVSLSSLNRHACATLPDVGRPKVVVCKEAFAEIAPWADVDARVEIFRGEEASRLLGNAMADPKRKLPEQPPTYVVDCIDNLDTKIDLLDYCYKHKIKCFSSMGAGAKADPSLIQVGDLNTTAEDPLARRVRRGLRAKGVWGGGVMDKKPKSKSKSKESTKYRRTGTEKKGGAKNETATEPLVVQERKDRQDERQATLEKLEGNSAAPNRKLEHSGRGAVETAAVRDAAATRPRSGGESKWSVPMSRRASSSSSRGSVFYSPLSSPAMDGNDDRDSDDSGNGSAQPFQLSDPSSEQAGDDDITIRRTEPLQVHALEAKATRSDTLQRPQLSAIQGGESESKPNHSKRASSLQELAAEDTRSSQSGKPARPTSPNPGTLAPMPEEAIETENGTDDDDYVDKSRPPYTIMCVFSNEKSDTRLLPLDEEEFQKGKVDELAALEDFRVRILPVLGPLPAMFGLAAATYVLCDISGKELEPLPGKNRRKTAERMWAELESAERKFPSPGSGHSKADQAIGPRRIPWTVEDVQYVFEEVYRSRSVVPPFETLSHGRILRWDSTLPLSVSSTARCRCHGCHLCLFRSHVLTPSPLPNTPQYSNVALFSRTEAFKHEDEVLKHGRHPVEVWGGTATRMFKQRMAEERRMNVLR